MSRRELDETLGGRLPEMMAEAVGLFETMLGDNGVGSNSGSEIEGILSFAIYVCDELGYYAPVHIRNEISAECWNFEPIQTPETIMEFSERRNVIYVYQQVKVDKYCVDFMAYMRITHEIYGTVHHQFLAVECDGHEFHEKTKAQAARDRARDRALLLRGIPSMRFTGSEVWRAPYECVVQIDKFFSRVASEVHKIPGDA
jgi:very-short-patch-repair endonuclease